MSKRGDILRGATCWVRRPTVRATLQRVDRLLLKLGTLPAARTQKEVDGRPELVLRFSTPDAAKNVRTKLIHSRISAWQHLATVTVHLDAWEEFQSWEREAA